MLEAYRTLPDMQERFLQYEMPDGLTSSFGPLLASLSLLLCTPFASPIWADFGECCPNVGHRRWPTASKESRWCLPHACYVAGEREEGKARVYSHLLSAPFQFLGARRLGCRSYNVVCVGGRARNIRAGIATARN